MPADPATARGAEPFAFRMPRLVLWMCAAGIILCLTVSQYALLALGIRYNVEGGNPVIKIHPASYMFMAGFAVFAFYRGCGPTRLIAWFRQRGWLLGFAASCLLVAFYKIALGDTTGTAAIVDSFFVPSLVLLMLFDTSPTYRQGLADMVVVLVVINAIVAITEAKLGVHLFPFVVHDIKGRLMIGGDFRSTALIGHPLRNGMITACAIIALAGLRWPLLIRAACGGLMFMAMLAFGGRSSTIIGLFCLSFMVLYQLSRYIRRSRAALAFALWSGTILVSTASAVVAALFLETSLGTRIVNGSFNDSSSQARYRLLDLMASIDFGDLLMGFSFDEIANRMLAIQLSDIESFWIYLLLYFGVLGFGVWLIGFLGAMQFVFRRISVTGRTIIVCAILVASTSVSLSSKDSLLDVVFALALGAGALPVAQRARFAADRGFPDPDPLGRLWPAGRSA